MVVRITLPASAGSIFIFFMTIGKVAPATAAASILTSMAKAIIAPSIRFCFQIAMTEAINTAQIMPFKKPIASSLLISQRELLGLT
tara:strand:- start:31 stop:288 length:258 start_codon:yes stop_codon:yes gene_type:complete